MHPDLLKYSMSVIALWSRIQASAVTREVKRVKISGTMTVEMEYVVTSVIVVVKAT